MFSKASIVTLYFMKYFGLCVCSGVLVSCGALGGGEEKKGDEELKEPVKAPPVAKFRLLGSISSINTDERFVMVEIHDALPDLGDAVLYSKRAKQPIATLRLSGEQMGKYFAADILSGSPQVLDPVFWRPSLENKILKKSESEDLMTQAPKLPVNRVNEAGESF